MSTSATQPGLASVLLVGVDVHAAAGDDRRRPESAAELAMELTANWSRAETGREALAQMRVTHFDLILAPTWLADMSVWDLLDAVRSAWPRTDRRRAGGSGSPAAFQVSRSMSTPVGRFPRGIQSPHTHSQPPPGRGNSVAGPSTPIVALWPRRPVERSASRNEPSFLTISLRSERRNKSSEPTVDLSSGPAGAMFSLPGGGAGHGAPALRQAQGVLRPSTDASDRAGVRGGAPNKHV